MAWFSHGGRRDDDIARARKFAKTGDEDARWALGRVLMDSARDSDRRGAMEILRKLAEQGHAATSVGFGFEHGIGVAKDDAEAGTAKQPRKAMRLHNTIWAFAFATSPEPRRTFTRLGCGCANLPSKTKCTACTVCCRTVHVMAIGEAVEIFRKLAEQEHLDGMTSLGLCCAEGIGVAKDEAEALKWYSRAGEKGHAIAQFNLANSFALGKGTAKDAAKAVLWYRRAAHQGDAKAQTALGYRLEFAIGTDKDVKRAVEWYRKAAEKGYATGQLKFAIALREGEGVDKDEAAALEWLRKADKNGNRLATLHIMQMRASHVAEGTKELPARPTLE